LAPYTTDTPILIVNNSVLHRTKSFERKHQEHTTTTNNNHTYSSARPPRHKEAPLVIQSSQPRPSRSTAAPADTMCTTDIYTYVYPDGRRETIQKPNLCHHSRKGIPCSANTLYKHPAQYVQYGEPVAPKASLPPTPTYTPRSNTPNYRSGDESDRSHRSGGSANNSNSKKKRASGVYVNGQMILDLDDSRHPRRERIVLVDNPPTPRTPPQPFTGSSTAPPSPNMPIYSSSSPHGGAYTHTYHNQPVFVDERRQQQQQRLHIEVVDNKKDQRASRHERHSSTSSHESRHSRHSSHSSDDEERRRRRAEERSAREEETRQRRLRERIAQANSRIASREAVPMPSLPSRRSTGLGVSFKRPVVEVVDHDAARHEKELADAVRRLEIDQARRERAQREEDEAQRQRLMERMMPKRRASVGPGSRRHRVAYDDGLYRWE
jgi:hypothetical protein